MQSRELTVLRERERQRERGGLSLLYERGGRSQLHAEQRANSAQERRVDRMCLFLYWYKSAALLVQKSSVFNPLLAFVPHHICLAPRCRRTPHDTRPKEKKKSNALDQLSKEVMEPQPAISRIKRARLGDDADIASSGARVLSELQEVAGAEQDGELRSADIH
jgi:hypothetical protein